MTRTLVCYLFLGLSFWTLSQAVPTSSASVESPPTGLLSNFFSAVQVEHDKVFLPFSGNCTTFPVNGNVWKTIEYNYFSYRIRKDGIARFDQLRQNYSHIASLAEFKRILFPAATEYKHPFFDCAFEKFFNHLMNVTPFLWLQWIDFDGSRFPFVWWQKVNVTGTGIFPARKPESGKSVIQKDAIPPAEYASWTWEDGGPNSSADSSGSASRNMTTEGSPVTSDAPSSFRGVPSLLAPFRPLLEGVRSVYNIYGDWRGLPKLQVKLSLV